MSVQRESPAAELIVYIDSASLELHMEVGREEFRKLGEMLAFRQVEVYGAISDRARAMLEQKVQMLGGAAAVIDRFQGFTRRAQARG